MKARTGTRYFVEAGEFPTLPGRAIPYLQTAAEDTAVEAVDADVQLGVYQAVNELLLTTVERLLEWDRRIKDGEV